MLNWQQEFIEKEEKQSSIKTNLIRQTKNATSDKFWKEDKNQQFEVDIKNKLNKLSKCERSYSMKEREKKFDGIV